MLIKLFTYSKMGGGNRLHSRNYLPLNILDFFQAWSSGRIQHLPMFFTTTPTAPMESGIPYHRQMQQNVNENSFPSYLSTSHLLNNSLNAVTDFEPQLFSSPSV